MNEAIPQKKICKSNVSNKPKLSSDMYKLNKQLMRILKAAKKNRLYEIKDKNRIPLTSNRGLQKKFQIYQ